MRIRVIGEIILLGTLPIALFLTIYQISPINQMGFLDPWLYTGYINNFGDLFQRYGLTYYSVRFGLIGPAMVLNKALGPINGYFAFCYVMVLVAGVPLYALFRKYFSIHAAIFAYATLTSSIWFARHVLWTHPDATAVPYLLAGVSIILLDPGRRRLCYLVVGALFSLAVNSNFFTIVVAGLSVVPYFIVNQGRLRQLLPSDAAFGLLGFVGVYFAAMLIYYAKLGVWKLYEPTFSMITWGFAGKGEIYRVKPDEWMFSTLYVYFPVFLGLCYLLVACKWKPASRIASAIAAYAVSVVLFFSWWQFASHGLIIELPYYFCYLIPALMPLAALIPVMLTSGVSLDIGRHILWTGTVVALVIPLLVARANLNFAFDSIAQFSLISAIAVLLLLFARRSIQSRLLAVTAYVIAINTYFFGYVAAPNDNRQSQYAFMFRDKYLPGGFDLYKIAVQFMRSMPRFSDDRQKLLFWYSNVPKDAYLSSLQSIYLWGYSRLHSMNTKENPGLPVLGNEELKIIDGLGAAHLVLIGSSQGDVRAGLAALDQKKVKYHLSDPMSICSGQLCVFFAIAALAPTARAHNASAEFSKSATLLKLSGRSLIDKLEKNYYGHVTQTTTSLFADESILFSPTSPKDHLATPFVPLVPRSGGGSAWVRLKIASSATARPDAKCKILVQDGSLITLFESDCGKGAADSEAHYFQVPLSATKLRATIQSTNETPTYLPTGISLDQGLGAHGE